MSRKTTTAGPKTRTMSSVPGKDGNHRTLAIGITIATSRFRVQKAVAAARWLAAGAFAIVGYSVTSCGEDITDWGVSDAAPGNDGLLGGSESPFGQGGGRAGAGGSGSAGAGIGSAGIGAGGHAGAGNPLEQGEGGAGSAGTSSRGSAGDSAFGGASLASGGGPSAGAMGRGGVAGRGGANTSPERGGNTNGGTSGAAGRAGGADPGGRGGSNGRGGHANTGGIGRGGDLAGSGGRAGAGGRGGSAGQVGVGGGAGTTGQGGSSGGSGESACGPSIPMTIPTPSNGTGEVRASTTVLKAGDYDFENQKIGVVNPAGCDGEGQPAVFELEDGVTIRNLIVAGGDAGGNGIVCKGNCTLDHVYWEDICEDAATNSKDGATMTIRSSIALNASDKVFQHNAKGGSKTVIIDSYVADFGKVWRSCGDCTNNGGPRHLVLNNVKVDGIGTCVAGANENYGDTVTITNLCVKGGWSASKDKPKICQVYQAVTDHQGESTKLYDGASQWNTSTCKVSQSDIKSW